MRPKSLALTLLLVALAPAALAQDWRGRGRIQGQVTDEGGRPIAGATLQCENPERGGGTTLTADESGKWVLGGIAPGTWNIDIAAQGYARKRLSVDLPAESARLRPIVVELEKAGPPPEVLQAYEKAEALYEEGRFAEARAEYEKLLALRPDLAPEIHQQIGFAYVQEKEYARGVAYLEQVLVQNPDNAQIRAVAAQAALEGGMLDKGRQLLSGLDDRAVDSPDVFYNMGVAFLNAGATEEAIGFFTKAIARDAAYVDGYFRRGLAYLQLGEQEGCKADMKKVVELSPDSEMGALARRAIEALP